ncbi:hypothetical protein C8J57DRAFT_1468389 [Mycena rebaudengoi]|nr:hypothetical protein C8J57DRAFT_1468389 [Mycena rebaudengoi]
MNSPPPDDMLQYPEFGTTEPNGAGAQVHVAAETHADDQTTVDQRVDAAVQTHAAVQAHTAVQTVACPTDSTHAIAQTTVNRMLPPLCATLTANLAILATGVAHRVNAAVQTHADDQTAVNRELPHQHTIPTANHAVPAIGAITRVHAAVQTNTALARKPSRPRIAPIADHAAEETGTDPQSKSEDEELTAQSPAHDSDIASTPSSMPDSVCDHAGRNSLTTRRRFHYVHFPAHKDPPFDVMRLEHIGTTRGEPVYRFMLKDEGPVAPATPMETSVRFDTPVSPYCLLYVPPPLDDPRQVRWPVFEMMLTSPRRMPLLRDADERDQASGYHDEEEEEVECRKRIHATLPPVSDIGTSAADRLSIPVFRSHGPVIVCAYYSSSLEPISRNERPIPPFSVECRESQRQLTHEQPQMGPFVGMLLAPLLPSPPHLDTNVLAPTPLQFRHHSPATAESPLFTWIPLPSVTRPSLLSIITNAPPHESFPATRPNTIFDNYLRDACLPHPRSPLQHRRITQQLASESVFHELLCLVNVCTPNSDTSMPSLRSIHSTENDAYDSLPLRNFIPAAAQSVHAEPSHTPLRSVDQLPVESVSAAELKDELSRIHNEFPHDEDERRCTMWRNSDQWNWAHRQQIKLFRHNNVMLVKKPCEDTVYIVTHYLTEALDYDPMAQGNYELLQHIGHLPPNTSAEEIIRLRSRLVCGFIDVAHPHTYCDDLEDTLRTVDSMAFDAPDGEQHVEIPTAIPPSPCGDQFCERFFSYHVVRQGPLHMAALKTEYDLDPTCYSYIATMRVCLLEGLRLLTRCGAPTCTVYAPADTTDQMRRLYTPYTPHTSNKHTPGHRDSDFITPSVTPGFAIGTWELPWP